jgi:hypothetical protein
MVEKARTAWELEAEARAVNATAWEPLPGLCRPGHPAAEGRAMTRWMASRAHRG